MDFYIKYTVHVIFVPYGASCKVLCLFALDEPQPQEEADRSTGQSECDADPEAEWFQCREAGQQIAARQTDDPIGNESNDERDGHILVAAQHPLKGGLGCIGKLVHDRKQHELHGKQDDSAIRGIEVADLFPEKEQ